MKAYVLLFSLLLYPIDSPATLLNFLLVLIIGVCSYLYQFFLTAAGKYAPVRLTSSFLYFAVVISLFFDWFIWKMLPSTTSFIGMGLIVIGAVLLVLLYPKEDYKKNKK